MTRKALLPPFFFAFSGAFTSAFPLVLGTGTRVVLSGESEAPAAGFSWGAGTAAGDSWAAGETVWASGAFAWGAGAGCGCGTGWGAGWGAGAGLAAACGWGWNWKPWLICGAWYWTGACC